MTEMIIGIVLTISFIAMVVYCIKGYNLMVGFFAMSTLWVILALVGNSIVPNPQMVGKSVIDVLKNVYQEGPEGYAQTILVNIFFSAFFGRVLMETGIAATLIRKVVELGGDRPRITMFLLCIVTGISFTSMTGIGPVISIGVIVLPILQALGIPAFVALFAFVGSIMAGTCLNIATFVQYSGRLSAIDPAFTERYTYNDYFQFGLVAMIVCMAVVLVVTNLALTRRKVMHGWAAGGRAAAYSDAPWYSWISVIMPVILVVSIKLPIIPSFIASSIFALFTCRKLKGNYTNVCRMLAKQFTDGAIDVAPMVGFLLMLSLFNKAAVYTAPYFKALIGGIFPTRALAICLLFALLVPLGFFRGPTTLTGAGTAVAAVVISIADWPVAFLYPLFAVMTIVPQHLDLTQSWVAWGLGYTKVNSREYMKYSIPTGWIAGAILCVVVYFMFGNLVR